MIRRGRTLGGVAVGIAVALIALPPVAAAQSAVDEYTLDIPGGGGSASGSSGGPSAGTAGSASASGSGGGDQRGRGARGNAAADTASGAGGGAGGGATGDAGGGAGVAPLHDGAGQTTDTDDRNAPEVVADTLLDGAMLPMLGALVLITGIGAWRLLRHRNTPTGAAG